MTDELRAEVKRLRAEIRALQAEIQRLRGIVGGRPTGGRTIDPERDRLVSQLCGELGITRRELAARLGVDGAQLAPSRRTPEATMEKMREMIEKSKSG